jgi:CBS domain-containing protein
METSVIRYRVADFLKQHPPFTAMDYADLVALAANGRVRFYEANEFLLWQGEPHKVHVSVIQQGTVSLWDERRGQAELRDVRGAGDLLGVEQFNGVRSVLLSARSTGDVVVYGFSAADFGELLTKYPYARQFVSALGSVVTDFKRTDERADPRRMFLHDVAGPLQVCRADQSVAEAARTLARTGAEALAIANGDSRILGLVTLGTLLAWVADGGGSPDRPLSELPIEMPPTLGPDTSIADGVMAMGHSQSGALAMTADGTPSGRLLAVLTPRDLAPVFGDQPAVILRDIRRAPDVVSLRALNRRARACALQYLTSATASDWVARFTDAADQAILVRLITLTGSNAASVCWCVCGASGRGESIVHRQPHLVLIHSDAGDARLLETQYAMVMDGLAECDYLPGIAAPGDPALHVATVAEWSRRYKAWIQNPVIEGMAHNRALFDLRPFHGVRSLWQHVRDNAAEAVDRDIVRLLAHDCLASLPPLTFYRDAVVEQSGEQTTVFRLEHSALRPLVDLGRVLGMAGREVMGTSTLDRFAMARRLLPAHEAIFRDAAETLRIVLWQQGRVGISQGTDGAELPPALLSRHDRHVLKSGFPVIQRLLEFSADPTWLDEL